MFLVGSLQQAELKVKVKGEARVSWDEVREWHGHIYTTKCKIAS